MHAMGDALSFVGPVVGGLIMGVWLDKQLHTSPLFLLVLTFLGIATSIWSLIKKGSRPSPPHE